jgi:DNA-binding SARP family transcriptional activator
MPAPRREADTAAGSRPSITLLGGFELRIGGTVVHLPPNGQRVVAFLALQDRPVHRARVAGILWCDSPDDLAAASLRSALWRIRRRGAGLVVSSGDELALAPDVRVDVHRLAREARRMPGPEGEPPTEADLLSGDLLPGWYEDWVVFEQERLRHLRTHALERLAETLAARGRYGEAIDAALAVIQAEPLRESAHRTLIAIHLEEGNRIEALRQYRKLEGLLRVELGLGPSPEVREMLASVTGDGMTTAV